MLPLSIYQNIQNKLKKNIYPYKLYSVNKEFKEDFSAIMYGGSERDYSEGN